MDAHDFLESKGVVNIGQRYLAITIEKWLNEFTNEKIIALEKIKVHCDGNITNENNIWHIANNALK